MIDHILKAIMATNAHHLFFVLWGLFGCLWAFEVLDDVHGPKKLIGVFIGGPLLWVFFMFFGLFKLGDDFTEFLKKKHGN